MTMHFHYEWTHLPQEPLQILSHLADAKFKIYTGNNQEILSEDHFPLVEFFIIVRNWKRDGFRAEICFAPDYYEDNPFFFASPIGNEKWSVSSPVTRKKATPLVIGHGELVSLAQNLESSVAADLARIGIQ